MLSKFHILVYSTSQQESPLKKESKPYGKETLPVSSGISQPKPWTSHSKITSKDCSEEIKKEMDIGSGSPET